MNDHEAVSNRLRIIKPRLPKKPGLLSRGEVPGNTDVQKCVWVLKKIGWTYGQIGQMLKIRRQNIYRIYQKIVKNR